MSNLWSTWLTVKEKPIFWQKLYELDVVAREFSKKKDKGKVNEEASSSNHGVEDILKGLKQRLMTGFSEVCVKVETMDKRLSVMEQSQYHLKKRARKQKAMEERLDDIENEMKKHEKEKENENNDGFNYQTMAPAEVETEAPAEVEIEAPAEVETEAPAEEEVQKEGEEEPEQAENVEKEGGIYNEEEEKSGFLQCGMQMMFLLWRRQMQPRKHLGFLLIVG